MHGNMVTAWSVWLGHLAAEAGLGIELEIRGSLVHFWEQLTNPAGFPSCEQPQELRVQGLGSRGALRSVGGKCLPGLFPGRHIPSGRAGIMPLVGQQEDLLTLIFLIPADTCSLCHTPRQPC